MPRSKRSARRNVRWGRIVLVLTGAALLIWPIFGLTMGLVFARRAPEIAYRWWPSSGDARAGVAAALLARPGAAPAQVERARRLSEGALRHEPTNVAAARTLGLAAFIQGRRGLAERLFAYSETLSRRDVPTQLWLIEYEVGRNNIAGALRHYDRALRTSTQIREVLLPILVRAAADPSTGPALATMVGERPLWWRDFAEQLFESSQSNRAILLVLSRLRLDPGRNDELTLLGAAINRLISLGDFAAAERVYERIHNRRPGGEAAVRNGGFEEDGRLPPLDWDYRSDPGLSAYPQAQEGAEGRRALLISSESGRGGYVARQLLLLAPGAYRIGALVGAVPSDPAARPLAVLVCAGDEPTPLLRLSFPAAGRLSGEFTVPAGCRGQWLTIEAGTSLDALGTTPWIDSIRVRAR